MRLAWVYPVPYLSQPGLAFCYAFGNGNINENI